MSSKIKNRQRVAFDRLIQEEIPEVLKNSSRTIKNNYKIEFAECPFNVNEPINKDGTIYGIIKTKCSITSLVTGEKISFTIDLLNMPILQELGFRIHGNDMQVLDSYNRTAGWSFYKKVKRDDTEIGATLLPIGEYVRSLDFEYSKTSIMVSRKDKEAGDKYSKIDLCTFLKALNGMDEVELIQMFGFDNPFVLNTFNPDRKKQKDIKGTNFNNRNDCIFMTAYALLGSSRVNERSVITDLQHELNKYLFDKNYFNLGLGNLKRLQNTQSFLNRGVNKYLAEDIIVNGKSYEAGITLTEGILQEIDNSMFDSLKVEHMGKIYTLRKFSIFTFRVLGMRSADKFSVNGKEFSKGHVFSLDDVEFLNKSNLTELNCLDQKGKIVKITRRTDASKLYIEDIYTAVSILFDNINGFDTYDNEYELTNRIVIPFDKRVCSILETHLDMICNKLERSLIISNDVGEDEDGLLPGYLNDFSMDNMRIGKEVYDLNKFISQIASSESLTGQMSDTTNIMAYLEKSNKVTSNIKSKSITDALVSVQDLQNGRLDPIDSPESSKIGIVHHRTILTKEDGDGNLLVPLLPVKNGEVLSEEPVYLTAIEEKEKYIAEWCETFKNEDGTKKERVLAKYCGNVITVDTNLVSYKEYSQLSSMSPARSCIPFQNHSNGKRLLMSCNHHKQAVPTFGSMRARVGTGCESILDVGNYKTSEVVKAFYEDNKSLFPEFTAHEKEILESDLELINVTTNRDSKTLLLRICAISKFNNSGKLPDTTKLTVPFARKTSEKNMVSYRINVVPDNIYHSEDIITHDTGYSLDQKTTEVYADYGALKVDDNTFNSGLALGMDLTVAFKTYESSTIDDAITISDEIVMDDTLTSIFMIDVKEELISSDSKDERFGKLYDVTNKDLSYIGMDGLPKKGTILKPGDVVMTYIVRGRSNSEKQKEVVLNNYTEGQVIDAYVYTKNDSKIGKVVLASRATAEEGDKMSGRHGNKGVIARIKPMEEMPYDPVTGRTVQVVLNPLGIPSRMNISQLLEVVVGEAMRKRDHRAVFSPFFKDDLKTVDELANACDIHPKYLCDGRTGKMFKRPINYGTLHMFKLIHMVNKKAHSIGSNVKVDPVFVQPRHGQKNDGGQSFEEMCCWCVSGVGATKVLQDIYTIQSDDIANRKLLSREIVNNPYDVHVDGVNRSDTVMQAFTRTMGCEIITVKDGYEFTPLTDDMTRSLASVPVEHEKALHASNIFGDSNVAEDNIKNKNKWGWIDLKCEIIHPTWLVKGYLDKLLLIRYKSAKDIKGKDPTRMPLNKISKEKMIGIIESRILVRLPKDGSRLSCIVAIDPEILKTLDENERELYQTGMSALVEVFKRIDVSATRMEYQNQVNAYRAKGKKCDTVIENLRICDVYINTHQKENPLFDNSLSEYVISSFPVMPQSFRPVIKNLSINDIPDFDWHYKQILNAVSDVRNKNKSQDSLLKLFETISIFIGYKKVDNLKYQTILLWFYGHNSTNKKHGKIRENVQKKRTVCSGRSVIIPMQNVKMKPTQLGVPFTMIVKMWGERLVSHIHRNYTVKDGVFLGEKALNLLNLLASNNKVKFLELYEKYYLNIFNIPNTKIITKFIEWIKEYIEGDVDKGLKPQVVMAGRQPSLHRFSIRAFYPKVVFSKAIQIHPLSCKGYNADFDGDTMWLTALLTEEAKEEAISKMSPMHNFINPKNSTIILEHSQDIVLGCYCATMLKNNADNLGEIYEDTKDYVNDLFYYSNTEQLKTDLENSVIEPYDFVCYADTVSNKHYLSTAGRVLFNSLIPNGFTDNPFTNPLNFPEIDCEKYYDLKYDGLLASGSGRGPIKYCSISQICKDLFEELGEPCIDVYQSILEFGFFFSDVFGVTLSIEDLNLETNKKEFIKKADNTKTLIENDYQRGLISAEDKKNAIVKLYRSTNDDIKKDLITSIPRNNNFFIIFDSGARGNASQLMQTSGAIGILQKTATEDLETSLTSNYTEGISSYDMHLTTYSSRTGVASTQNETATAGYATRHAVYSAAGLEITEYDCGKKDWWYDIEWADHRPELDAFSPTQEWFEKNLLGKVTADKDTFDLFEGTLGSVNGFYGIITMDSFDRLKDGFHHIALRTLDEFYDEDDYDEDDNVQTMGKNSQENKEIVMIDGYPLSQDVIIYDVALEGKGLFTPIKMEIIDNPESIKEFRRLADIKRGSAYGDEQKYFINDKCISVIKEKHIKTLYTKDGTFSFRYKMALLSRSLLKDREGRNLPFLKAHTEVFPSGKILRVNLITEKTLDWIEDKGLDTVNARIMLDCEAEHGVCSRCYGLGFSDAKLQDIGANIGIEAAQSIGEPAAQLTMSLVNSGGVAGESVANGVTIIDAMLKGNLPKSSITPEVANMDGYINIIRYDDTVGIRIEPENYETNSLCAQCLEHNNFMECPYGRVANVNCLLPTKQRAARLKVGNGQYVKAGDQLTVGFLQPSGEKINARFIHPDEITMQHIPNLEKLLRTKQIIWLDCYFYTFKENNIFINPRHFEIFARLQIFKITVMDDTDISSKFLQGGRYDYSEMKRNHYCPKDLAIRASKIEEVVTDNSGLLTALSFEDVPKLLAQFTNEKKHAHIKYNNAIIGGLNIGADLQKLKQVPKNLYRPKYMSETQDRFVPDGVDLKSTIIESNDVIDLDNISLGDIELGDLAEVADFGNVFENEEVNTEKDVNSTENLNQMNLFKQETTENSVSVIPDLSDLGISMEVGKIYDYAEKPENKEINGEKVNDEEVISENDQLGIMDLFSNSKDDDLDLTNLFAVEKEIPELSEEAERHNDNDMTDEDYDIFGISGNNTDDDDFGDNDKESYEDSENFNKDSEKKEADSKPAMNFF